MLKRILPFLLTLVWSFNLVEIFKPKPTNTVTVLSSPVAEPDCECQPARIFSDAKKHYAKDSFEHKTSLIMSIGANRKVVVLKSLELEAIKVGYADEWGEVVAIFQAMKAVEKLPVIPATCGGKFTDSIVLINYNLNNGETELKETLHIGATNLDDFKSNYISRRQSKSTWTKQPRGAH
jgi:hypothetical protein